MQQLINTACFPPRRVLWQQPKDSLKAGQGSLSKVPLSPNNVTNSVLTWMLLQEVPEAGKITQLIKLAVRKPSAKCRDTLPQQPWVCGPCGAGTHSGGKAAATCQNPGLGSAASGGIQGKNDQSLCRAASASHTDFLGSSWILTWRRQSTVGCLLHPHPQAPVCCWGEGLCVPWCGLSPAESGTARQGLAEGTQPMNRGGRPSQSLPTWEPVL